MTTTTAPATMRAARYFGNRDLRIEEVPVPAVQPGTVKVRVEWCGICGTDLHEFEDGPIFAPTPDAPHPISGESVPLTLGHEFAGVVAEVGAGVEGFSPGDRVVVEPFIVCGECEFCTAGDYNLCVRGGFIGLSGGGGGFSEFVVAPVERVYALGDLSTEVGALVEPIAVGYHAVRRSGIEPGQTAVVFGAGPIGLVTMACLRAIGVEQVISVEMSAIRKEKAPAAGATLVLDPSTDDIPARIREQTGGLGTDVAFECVGLSPALQAALDSTRNGGTVVNVSIWGHKAEIDMFGLVMRELNLIGTSAYCGDHAAVIELLQQGRIDAEQFITGRIGVEDIVDGGFRQLIENKDENVKILVHP
ncbi:(R,R)-butanediol dehydrogenase/meso-butanediol dehydrogenase/diacetyl reductase [Propionibacteriaceae bacterium ES.041]|uniref:2,3-butanediol dehydrogenase n=1 Tax=Enemella evansiae TaxID=2016499 RepID=UPI000C01236C|nr:2,3-butanediol dehydrogenase [Enemella evansiae]PFG68391.1 (R,R)-butanediol dehydrogenase/meso-butanediol dehydrogenase/diacetyl reductase [Propionibacteriaceae bacterium ES.041]TDO87703.1 (R,R)-butanediol dehydrogenase/meso-butanediol dehydrogenase/diacetyl reductase [Enemella evansiae]